MYRQDCFGVFCYFLFDPLWINIHGNRVDIG